MQAHATTQNRLGGRRPAARRRGRMPEVHRRYRACDERERMAPCRRSRSISFLIIRQPGADHNRQVGNSLDGNGLVAQLQ
jgi:hypothetical protein